jgi:cytochrome c oxidase accessory protein FixG
MLPKSESQSNVTLPTIGGCKGSCGACGDEHVGVSDALLPANEHVLSTLEKDGTRRWMYPKLSMGMWWHRRRILAYILMVVFVVVPHLRINGKPIILLDIAAREFTVLGKTFLPTDTVVLAMLMLSVFLTIVLVTAITGRAWCGWACPQTVYMEFLFRPIDRFFGGVSGKGGLPKRNVSAVSQVARIGVYVALCMFLAHTFLAYFVGTERLAVWVRSSPIEHPTAFLVMGATTIAMLYDFLFFREQLCVIACPYGRFQSVMLDAQSMIVAYDPVRGEPRKKGKHEAGEPVGDCVDCNRCVVVCPTGIDIRNGLQMECINCTQCIDACDDVMSRLNKPKGLIRYSSQDSIARKPRRILRARTIIYPIVLSVILGGLGFAIASKSGFDARAIRGKGAPFSMTSNGMITNAFQIRLVNRLDKPQTYDLSISGAEDATLSVVDQERLTLHAGESALVPITIMFPSKLTALEGNRVCQVLVADQSGNTRNVDLKLLGPVSN